jgi:hypothetical protein
MALITAVVVVLVLAAAGVWLLRYSPWQEPAQRRLDSAYGTLRAQLADRLGRSGRDRERLRRTYGREYDRLLARNGEDHAAVGRELEQRERERRALTIKPLGPADRSRLGAAWQSAQAGFVDDPGTAARRAEQLVGDALASLGYPAGDPERQLALASVDHAQSLSEFRDGHELLVRSQSGAPGVDTTEQLRQAVLRFRVFFDELTGTPRRPLALGAGPGPAQDREALV